MSDQRTTAAPSDAGDGLASLIARARGGLPGGQVGLAVLLAAVLVLFSMVVPGFVSGGTTRSFMYQLPLLGVLSLAMVVPLITGGLNLAIIATANQSALLMVFVMEEALPTGAGTGSTLGVILLAMLAGLALCILIGTITGILVAYTGVHPILVTLGTKSLIDGISIYLTRGKALSGIPALFGQVGNLDVLGVPLIFAVLVLTALLFGVILKRTPFGLACAMIGSNMEATRYSAVDTRRVLIGVYVVSSVACFVAALVMLVSFNSASADYAQSYLLVTILAAVLGGVDPFGGFGTITGLMLALCVLQVISTGFNQLGVSAYLTVAIWGGILIFTVMLQTFGPRWSSALRRRAPTDKGVAS